MTHLIVVTEDLTTKGEPGFRIWVKEKRESEVERTVWVGKVSGLEVDFYNTLLTEIHSAWMYGKAGDVHRAAAGVMRQARRHARLHEAPLFR